MDSDLKMPPAPWDILPLSVSDPSYLTLPAKPGPCEPTQSPLSPPSPNPLDLKLNNLSTPGPAIKRARNGPMGGGHLAARCLVEGCKADLDKCREYHRRHKVCEAHSKSPVVTVAGREQRFCQQCSRFHLLVEFDDAKRSCRKRLEGHNRRRRKPPTDNLINHGGFLANHQGSRFGSYPPLFSPVRPGSNNNWPNMTIKPEPISFSSSLYPKLRHQFPFLQDEIPPNRTTFTGTLTPLTMDASSDCALSLLSSSVLSSPVQSSSSIMTIGMVTDNIPMAQPLVPGFQFGTSSSDLNGVSGFVGSNLISSFSANGESNFQGLFQLGAGEGSSQAMPSFTWN